MRPQDGHGVAAVEETAGWLLARCRRRGEREARETTSILRPHGVPSLRVLAGQPRERQDGVAAMHATTWVVPQRRSRGGCVTAAVDQFAGLCSKLARGNMPQAAASGKAAEVMPTRWPPEALSWAGLPSAGSVARAVDDSVEPPLQTRLSWSLSSRLQLPQLAADAAPYCCSPLLLQPLASAARSYLPL